MGLGFSLAPRWIAVLFALLASSLAGCASRPAGGDRDRRGTEIRGVFVATAYNLDWPSRPGLHHAVQKDEIRAIVQRADEINCNVIILQVRAFADRIHRATTLSTPEPWAEPLNRTHDPDMSGAAKFDPLAEWIDQCNRNDIELHLWVNPFRVNRLVTYRGKVLPVVVGGNGHHLYLDPSSEDVQAYVMEVINDLLDYSVPSAQASGESERTGPPVMMSMAGTVGADGMLFDHDLPPPPPRDPPIINPPSTRPGRALMLSVPAAAATAAIADEEPTRARWLKKVSHDQHGVVNPAYDPQALSRFMEKVSKVVRGKPGRLFGISPAIDGGRHTTDAKTWVSQGLVDYVIPEFYKEGAQGDLEAELKKWIDEADKATTKPAVVAGLATVFAQVPKEKSSNKPWGPDVIDKQIKEAKQARGTDKSAKASGHAFYTWSSLREPRHAGPPDDLGRETIRDKHQPYKARPFKPRPGHP